MQPTQDRRRRTPARRTTASAGARTAIAAALVVVAGIAGATHLVEGNAAELVAPFASLVPAHFTSAALATSAGPSADAFGRSGEVKIRFALPGAPVEFPLEVSGDPATLRYEWVRASDGVVVDSTRTIAGATVTAPSDPGFYHLALVRGAERRTVEEITVAVLVPFEDKQGVWLGGYRIGNYRAEDAGRGEPPPPGFVKVSLADANLSISKHLRVSDFLTHDEQQQWPRYAAVDARLLDKIELVIGELGRWKGGDGLRPVMSVDVHSGFRTPWHNRRVRRAARDSRHQYGDAADVVIDADGDGRYTARDTYLIEVAVDQVEMRYPDLAGGTGLYLSRRYHTPYVHIDARGKRTRWKS